MNSLENFASFDRIELDPSDLDRYVPVLDVFGGQEALAAYVEACQESLKKLHEGQYHAEHLIAIKSRMIDRLVISLFLQAESEIPPRSRSGNQRATLIAQGGYGREEMNVHSDIDIVFIAPQKKGNYIETLTEKVLYPLWDLGLEVGNATRTLPECKKLMQEDITIMTSLLDARYLAGDKTAFTRLVSEIGEMLQSKALQKKLIRRKLDEKKSRVKKQGDSVFVLEPNVKESAGGLREIHLPLWIAKIQGREGTFEGLKEEGLLDDEELKTMILARNFLWRLRNELHLMVGRKVDLLTFHRQEAIAPRMGFQDDGEIIAVEKFMQTYYRLAYQAATISDALIRRMTSEGVGLSRLITRLKAKNIDECFKLVDGQIAAKSRDVFEKDPVQMLILFKHVQQTGFSIHPETKDHLRALSQLLVAESFRQNGEAIGMFRGMMGNYLNLGTALFAMHDVHFLDEWLPEFKKLRCRMQHDVYHIYTIDTHSIFAVDEISKLARGEYHEKFPVYEKILGEVQNPEILNLGIFLHDVGKGEGGNHSVKGAAIGNRLTKRLGFSEAEQKGVEFLILSHLLMPHLSQRRDLDDAEMIIQFARSMGTMDNLNMLFLLTWADIRAVGPEAWTDWKGTLLLKLYEKTREVIEKGEFSKEKTRERVAKAKESLIAQIGNRFSREEFSHFLGLMPPRYFFAEAGKEAWRHFLLHKQAEKTDIVVEFKTLHDQSANELLLYSPNAPQVFSLVTGVMLAFGINIIGADLFPTTDGHLLLLLAITDASGKPVVDAELFERLTAALRGVLFGQSKVDELIAKRQVPDYLAKKPVQKALAKVIVDNDVSAYYTVIDVYTHDRLGLLFDITRTLNQLGCYVEVSKISTKVEQVTDTFYVKDIFGHKIMAPDKLKAIKSALQEVVGGE
ncbi:MAG: [protein-PII] uridylyltransferase [Deltaproteobacteria bacterium]|nr:[protein-PII] uridylyltransferase [Deltaproteobacteria bacterium]